MPYLILLLFSLIILTYLIIQSFKNNRIKNIVSNLQDEFTRLLYTWNEGIIGTICTFIINRLHLSPLFRQSFFIIHFMFFYILRLLLLLLFINFCFFHGDLKYLIYFSFFSFIKWIFNFLEYYLLWFINANLTFANDLIITSYQNPQTAHKKSDENGFVTITNLNEIIFTLTPEAMKRGFIANDLPGLSQGWFRLNNILSFFLKYKLRFKYFSYFNFICYIICWFYIVHFFFIADPVTNNILNTFPWFRLPLRFRNTNKVLARDGRFLKESVQNHMRETSGGKFSPGHPVYGESKPDGSYVVEGQFTTGPGATHGPIPGSQQKLEDPTVKNKLDNE